MSSLLTKPLVQHHLSRVRPVQLRDFPLHLWGNLTVKDPLNTLVDDKSIVSGASKGIDLETVVFCQKKNGIFKNHLKFVKESRA